VRISRRRVLVRIALLVIGGVFMLVRAVELGRAGRFQGLHTATLAERLALVWGLMGVLALLTAAGAAWSLRRRRHRHTLHLDDVAHRPGSPDKPSEDRTAPDGGPTAPRERQ
jgi:hypothetical protein